MVFQQHQTRLPSAQIKALKHLHLVALHVNGQQIKSGLNLVFNQHRIQRAGRHLHHRLRIGAQGNRVGIEGGVHASDQHGHGLTVIDRAGTGHLNDRSTA